MKIAKILSTLIALLAAEALAWRPKYGLNPSKVVYALNCGSNQRFKSKDGFMYEGDRYFREGVIATYIDHPKVPYSGFKYTRDQNLHKTERYNDKGDLVYDLPINSYGDYVLILQFAEVNFERTGQRVIDIKLGDTIVRPSHDTLKAGRISSVSIYIPFSVRKGGEVRYADRLDCENAFDDTRNTLKLVMSALRDNPKVDGIILFKGTIEETNFFYLDEIRDYFDQAGTTRTQNEQLRDQMMEEYMMKKRMKKKVRNDYEEHDEFETGNIITEATNQVSKKLIAAGFLGLFALICLFNRRKGAKNPIILVKDDAYRGRKQRVGKKNKSKKKR